MSALYDVLVVERYRQPRNTLRKDYYVTTLYAGGGCDGAVEEARMDWENPYNEWVKAGKPKWTGPDWKHPKNFQDVKFYAKLNPSEYGEDYDEYDPDGSWSLDDIEWALNSDKGFRWYD